MYFAEKIHLIYLVKQKTIVVIKTAIVLDMQYTNHSIFALYIGF